MAMLFGASNQPALHPQAHGSEKAANSLPVLPPHRGQPPMRAAWFPSMFSSLSTQTGDDRYPVVGRGRACSSVPAQPHAAWTLGKLA